MFNKKIKRQQNLFKDIVLRYAKESHCLSKKVAAIAVKRGRIIATGINGTAEGLLNCDDFFKQEFIRLKISKNKNITFKNWIKTEDWRKLHHEWSNENEIHAEQSLICEASRNGINLTNVDIYISIEPCVHCSKLLAALKPKHIFYVNIYDKASIKSKELLKNAGIIIQKI